MTITEFLEARIGEDESRAWSEIGAEYFADGAWPEECAQRILAECAAKRAIVGLHAPVKDCGWKSGAANDYLWCSSCGSIDDSPEAYPCDTLKALAAIYADHFEYQQEWAA
jgi:hypothetical protein